ncbi:phosphoserine phosphatase SerB [Pleionea sediminis]|uniref:phosphoserine phosphatase SerB n=1 Tax=Pleionea sediminis TaxID=2569479 RepID=UPI001184E39A|nr:phosphoserine phosphatase SerB [Pleionea sediminis]
MNSDIVNQTLVRQKSTFVSQEINEEAQFSLRIWNSQTLDFPDLNKIMHLTKVDAFKVIRLTEASFEVLLWMDEIAFSKLREWLSSQSFNYALVASQHRFIKPKLMVFDMDSTLIQMECIDELARQCGFYDKVSEITERAMRGELDFSESLRERVALLDGLPLKVIDTLASSLPVTKGVNKVTNWAKTNNCKVAVVSGGFVPFVNQLKNDLGLDYAFANTLEENSGTLTGKVLGTIVDGHQKRNHLIEIRDSLGLKSEEVWAIGDGANDLPMMEAAGLGVAFDAKPKVRKEANASIYKPDMSQLITLLTD